jgi:hypothetical protein
LPLLVPALVLLMAILLTLSLTLIVRAARRTHHFGGAISRLPPSSFSSLSASGLANVVAHGGVFLLVIAAVWTALPTAGVSRRPRALEKELSNGGKPKVVISMR